MNRNSSNSGQADRARKIPTCSGISLFREERISSGTAAELLDITKAEFIDLLDRHGIAYFTQTPEELAAQVEALRDPPSDDEGEAD